MKSLVIAAACLLALGVVMATGFTREYVVSASGLLDLRTKLTGNTIVVTGSLLASGARVERVTAERYGQTVLIRVYAEPITEKDDLSRVRGTIAAVVARGTDLQKIVIGDGERTRTIGHVFAIPVRIPRFGGDNSGNRVIWTAP